MGTGRALARIRLLASAAMIFTASCSGTSHQVATSTTASRPLAPCPGGPQTHGGNLAVTLGAVGGPAATGLRPLPGVIHVRSATVSCSYAIAKGHRLRVGLPLGIYVISGRSPLYEDGRSDCKVAGPVVIGIGSNEAAVAVCQER